MPTCFMHRTHNSDLLRIPLKNNKLHFSHKISRAMILWKSNKKTLFVEISAELCFILSPWTKQWLFLVLYISHAVAEMIKYSSQIEIVFDAALSPTSRGPINWLIGMQVRPSRVKFYYDSEVKFWWHNSWLWIFCEFQVKWAKQNKTKGD